MCITILVIMQLQIEGDCKDNHMHFPKQLWTWDKGERIFAYFLKRYNAIVIIRYMIGVMTIAFHISMSFEHQYYNYGTFII